MVLTHPATGRDSSEGAGRARSRRSTAVDLLDMLRRHHRLTASDALIEPETCQ